MNYSHNMPFLKAVQAFVRKSDWESRVSLTSIAKVEQENEDEISFWRRCETISSSSVTYELVTINRKEKTLNSEDVHNMIDDGYAHVMQR